jgi:gentisate 1,2-dioxygenase
MSKLSSAPSSLALDRAASYERIGEERLAPLSEAPNRLVTKTPESPAAPVLWDDDTVVRPRPFEPGDQISAAEAERRVSILENPALPGRLAAT